MLSKDAHVTILHFGRFLNSMVMPSIGLFVAWGFIAALFGQNGWLPNETASRLVDPILRYVLPLLIGYTGGKMVGGERGAMIGAIATAGVVIGVGVPMLFGAMIAGPAGGWAIRLVDQSVHAQSKRFGPLIDSFSAGVVGAGLAVVAVLATGPAVSAISQAVDTGVEALIKSGLAPLVSILVEPAKILSLGGAVNDSVLAPLAVQQIADTGRSALLMIEADPGPGLGLLLACALFGGGNARQSAPISVIIHFFGGVHDVCLPYVLAKPQLIVAMIGGAVTGAAVLAITGAGLSAPASPGSIFVVLTAIPAESVSAILLSILAAGAVSFGIAAALLKSVSAAAEDEDGARLAEAAQRIREKMAQSKDAARHAFQTAQSTTQVPAVGEAGFNLQNTLIDLAGVRHIVIACNAGTGSAAMGASLLRKKLKDAGLSTVRTSNAAIDSLPSDANIVITHRDLTERARRVAPSVAHMSIGNFIDGGFYDRLVHDIVDAVSRPTSAIQDRNRTRRGAFTLAAEQVFLNLPSRSKIDAIRYAGELLVKAGYVSPAYIDAMLQREEIVSTYLGQGLAVPHGTGEAKHQVIKTGIVVCQYPNGVPFGPDAEDVARLVIGIAAKNNDHMDVISALARALDDEATIDRLVRSNDPMVFIKTLRPDA